MGAYADWADVVDRYSMLDGIGDATKMEATHIEPSENEVNARLSSSYSVPFESNNITAKDLTIQLVYLRAGHLKNENWENFKKYIDDRFDRLLDGSESMLTTSGDLLTAQDLSPAYHTHAGYKPMFDMGPIELQEVDSDLVSSEIDKRR